MMCCVVLMKIRGRNFLNPLLPLGKGSQAACQHLQSLLLDCSIKSHDCYIIPLEGAQILLRVWCARLSQC